MRSRRFARKLRPEISRRGKKMMGRRSDDVGFNDNSCGDSIVKDALFFFFFQNFNVGLWFHSPDSLSKRIIYPYNALSILIDTHRCAATEENLMTLEIEINK